MKPHTVIAIATFTAATLAAGAAFGAPPASLAGTTWTVQANRDSEQLVITNQGGAGAPGSAICRVIIGTIGPAPIRGFYCPDTGRVKFLHNNMSTGVTVRVFSGNVSEAVIGQPLYLGGTMAVFNAAFDPLGEYNFSAVKP